MTGTPLYCPNPCGRRLGWAPGKVIWTGSVERLPLEPEGLLYIPCRNCAKKKRPQWQRFEVAPPEHEIEVEVKPDNILKGEAA